MDNIEIDLNEISTIDGVEIDSDKLQNINLGFGEIIYVDKEDITDHDKLNNLDYESSGHTGFASSKEVAEINERLGKIDTATLQSQIEENRNNISTVSESVSAISNDYLKSEDKLALENSISENSEAITNLSNAQNTMSEEIGNQIEGLNTNIAQNAQDIINVSNVVDAHGEDIVKIDSRVSEIDKDYLTSSDAQNILSEVNKVSEKAGEVDKRVETIEGDYLSSEDKTELQDSITATNTQLSEVSTQLVNVGTRVGDIENDYLTSGDKASLQEQITANANSITVLSEGIDPEKIDGLKEVTEYVNNHLIEVVYLDQKITANTEALEAQQEDVASISNRVKTIEEDYALNSDLGELSTQVGAIDERVTALEESGSSTPSGEPLVATYNITSANTTITIKQMKTPTSIDWGDGTLLEDVSSITTYTHTYASSGVYIVKIYGNINSFWTSSTFANQKQLTKIVLPNTITSYSNRAFEGCTNLIEVKLSNNGNNITDYLFKGCSSLKEINIPACVVRIGSTAFKETSIQSMVIPRSVTTIAGWNFGETLKDLTIMGSPTLGEGVFYYSENLSTLRMMGAPPTLPSRAFKNTNTQIIVPSKYLNDYKTAWSEYADQIDAYALVGELPENEDVSLPIASTDTLGGVKVGESMQINDNGVIDTKPLSYIYCSTADTSVNNIDGDGIQCTIYEIEVETQTEDGNVHYEYARDNEIGIPIVEGKGITITKNDNNRAEISATLNKGGIKGYIDTYFNDVSISENGIYTYGDIEITDGDDNLVDTIGSNVTLPIVAGEGISITKNSNNKAEIGVDDIPTSKLFKDVNEIEIGHIDINNLYYSNAGIVYFSDVSFMDDDGGDLAKTTAYHRLPIVAGEGISIAENSDHTKAVISANGLATESYVDTKVADLVNSAPETLNTLGELATAIQNHEDEYDALLETVGNKANKSDLATVATSGNYNDLSNKPTIPSNTSQLTNDKKYMALDGGYIDFTNGKVVAIGSAGVSFGFDKVELEEADETTIHKTEASINLPITEGDGILFGIKNNALSINANLASGSGIGISKLADGRIQINAGMPEISSTDFMAGDTAVQEADNNGIQCTFDEIEYLTAKGDVTYSTGQMLLPIVAGSGISIAKNGSGKAEISASMRLWNTYVYTTNTSLQANHFTITYSLPKDVTPANTLDALLPQINAASPQAIIQAQGIFTGYPIVQMMVVTDAALYIEIFKGAGNITGTNVKPTAAMLCAHTRLL